MIPGEITFLVRIPLPYTHYIISSPLSQGVNKGVDKGVRHRAGPDTGGLVAAYVAVRGDWGGNEAIVAKWGHSLRRCKFRWDRPCDTAGCHGVTPKRSKCILPEMHTWGNDDTLVYGFFCNMSRFVTDLSA